MRAGCEQNLLIAEMRLWFLAAQRARLERAVEGRGRERRGRRRRRGRVGSFIFCVFVFLVVEVTRAWVSGLVGCWCWCWCCFAVMRILYFL